MPNKLQNNYYEVDVWIPQLNIGFEYQVCINYLTHTVTLTLTHAHSFTQAFTRTYVLIHPLSDNNNYYGNNNNNNSNDISSSINVHNININK